MRLFITAAARADLTEIGDFIQHDNPARAASFVHELVDRCEELADAPHRHPPMPRRPGIRRRAYRGYIIIYRVCADTIEVLHVFHGARDYERLLGRDDDPPL
jgi:toxin ParE1/3/4